MKRLQKKSKKKSHPHKWFEIVFGTLLAIQCIRELIFAFGRSNHEAKIRAFALGIFYGLVSLGIWRIYWSKASK